MSETPMNATEARKLCEERSTEQRHLVGCRDCGYEWLLDYDYNEHFHVEMCVCCGSVDIFRKRCRFVLVTSA